MILDTWCREFEGKFKEAPCVGLSRLEALCDTVAGVQARKDPEGYVHLSMERLQGSLLSKRLK